MRDRLNALDSNQTQSHILYRKSAVFTCHLKPCHSTSISQNACRTSFHFHVVTDALRVDPLVLFVFGSRLIWFKFLQHVFTFIMLSGRLWHPEGCSYTRLVLYMGIPSTCKCILEINIDIQLWNKKRPPHSHFLTIYSYMYTCLSKAL